MSRLRLLALAVLLAAAAPARAQIPAAEYAARRAALLAGVDSGVALVFGAAEAQQFFPSFIQHSPFLYFAGFDEADAAMLIVKRGEAVAATMFAQPSDPRAEVWTGRRSTFFEIQRRLGVPARSFETLAPALDSLLASGLPFYFVTDHQGSGEYASNPHGAGNDFVRALRAARGDGFRVAVLDMSADRLRGTKSPAEIELIRKAVEITSRAQREAMRLVEPGLNEFEVQALVEYTFRRNGADRPGFASIIASGPNSTTLHYMRDDRFMQAGETLVMDIGASYRGYSADVTRTVPVSGTFSSAQRDIYQIVRGAQAAAERAAVPGATWQALSRAARDVLAAGLTRLGLIESPDATYDGGESCARAAEGGCPQWSLFYMHGLGHGIGLDVHDPDRGYYGPFGVGSAFTLEPGIYVRGNLLDIIPDTERNRALKAKIGAAVAKYASIGVRIEDDYVITDRGTEWISRAPREIAEIEALMRQRYAGPAPREAEVVEWYRAGQR